MKTQTTFKGTEATSDLASRVENLQERVEAAVPGARFTKYVVERRGDTHAVGLVVTRPDGETWVRHAEAGDWERAFLEIERRLDRLAPGE